ncbi:MAG: hypothetical protein HC817_05155 [Saprospiraceae bacterium]|nr:hypothetical protein [Saprospiraceae bacterium]
MMVRKSPPPPSSKKVILRGSVFSTNLLFKTEKITIKKAPKSPTQKPIDISLGKSPAMKNILGTMMKPNANSYFLMGF